MALRVLSNWKRWRILFQAVSFPQLSRLAGLLDPTSADTERLVGTQMSQLYLLRVVLFFVRRIVRDRFTWATMTHLTVESLTTTLRFTYRINYYFELKHPVHRFPVEEVHKYHRKRLPNIIYSLTKTMSHRSPPLPQCEQKQTTPYKTNGNET